MRLLFTALACLISISLFGQCEGNCIDGYGQYIFSNGKYIGNFSSGMYYGEGELILNDGDTFKGNWENGFLNGRGTHISSNGNSYSGNFNNDVYDGYGEMTFSNGDIYNGQWASSLQHGYGEIFYKNGEVYHGQWNSGHKHGNGELIDINGNVYEVQYEYDNIVIKQRIASYNTSSQNKINLESDITTQMDNPEMDNSPKLSEKLQAFANSAQSDIDKFLSGKDKAAGKSNSETPKQNIRVRVTENKFQLTKVAVVGKESNLCDGSKDDGQGLAELVEGELLGIYGVVERKHLEEILDEQRLSMSGLLLEDSDFAQAGCLAGAQGTVLASYGCLQDKTKIQIKLVDCSTSDLYWSATGVDVSEFELLDALRVELNK